MQQTVNLKLNKLELTDEADITLINPNWESIDTEITNIKKTKADTSYVDTKVASLVGSAPEALDTLKELSDALGNDPNFATTVATQIGTKVDKVSGKGLSTNDYTTAEKTKLSGIATNANNYTHPSTHPVSMITGLHSVATSGDADTVDGKHASDFLMNYKSTTVDINTLTASGVYRVVSTNANLPSGCDFGQVLVLHGDSDTVVQIVGDYRSKVMYWRSGNPLNSAGTGSWGVWNRLYHTGDKPTPADIGASPSNHTHSYLPLSGGTLTNNISYSMYSSTQTPMKIYGGDANGQGLSIGAGGATIISSGEGKGAIETNVTPDTETMMIGSDYTIDFYTALQNGWASRKTMTMGTDGRLTNNNGFVGNLSGNATTATTLQTARTINGVSFDGSANITVADSTKLPLSGGSLSGVLNTNSQIKSTVATGTAPLTVASTTAVTNLNADMIDGLHSSSFIRSDTSNGYDIRLKDGDGRGLRFWDSDSYKISMSSSTNATYGGRMTGETTSDFNMYFKMSSGTNRGFVFKGTSGNVMGVDGNGDLRVKGSATIGDNKVKMEYNSTTESLDFIFV